MAAWRASGLSKGDFAAKRGYSRTALDKWSKKEAAMTPTFLRLEIERTRALDVVVEVGAARIRVQQGFDATLLAQVVAALSGGGT